MFVLATFRANFPEFSDVALYTDEMLNFWATIATLQVKASRWKTMTDIGISLYVAHEITLAAQNYKSGSIGGTPGQSKGPLTSKAVGPASASYDSQSASEKDAGHWNLTSYGKQFIRLARVFGAGVVQL